MSTLQNVDFFQNVNFTERALLILMFLVLPVGKAVSVQWTILSRNNLCFVALHTRGVTWPYFRGQKWHFIQPQHSLYLDRFIAERERGRKSANYWRFFCIPNCTFSTQDRTIQGCFHLNYNYYEQTKIKQNSLFSLSFSYLITRVAAGCEFMPLNSDPDPTFHFQFQKKKKTWLDSGSRSSIFYGSGSDRTQIRIPALNLAEGHHDLYNVTYRGAYGRRTAV